MSNGQREINIQHFFLVQKLNSKAFFQQFTRAKFQKKEHKSVGKQWVWRGKGVKELGYGAVQRLERPAEVLT